MTLPSSSAAVLVVDDDAPTRRLLVRILEGEGYRADQAGTGREALELFRKNEYQLAFLDIRLPDFNGLDLLAALKKSGRKTEVIMQTAYASLQSSIEALNQGALSYIIKPFQPAEVRLAARRALDKRALEDENARLLRDLTRKNEELEQTCRKLESMTCRLVASEKQAALTTLGGGIAHELNNPLTGILGMVTLLLENETPGSVRATRLIKIQEQVRRCARIIKDLLVFTREVSGVVAPLDVNEIIEKTLALMDYQFSLSGVTVTPRLAHRLPEVKANPGQLGQVFLNILLNALESLEGKKEATIEIATGRNEGMVTIAVADNGRGIPPENLSRLFEPFFTTKEAGRGSGMGLAVCQGIVSKFGGRIEAASEPGKGSVFTVLLPL
jgi:signal transduction histidine kinase